MCSTLLIILSEIVFWPEAVDTYKRSPEQLGALLPDRTQHA